MKKIHFQTRYLRDVHLLYRDFCHASDTILYESAEIVQKTGVQSLIGYSCALKVSCDDLCVRVRALNANGQGLLALLAKELGMSAVNDELAVQYHRPDTNLTEDERLCAPGPLDPMRALQKIIAPCTDIFIGGTIAFDFINNYEFIGEVPRGENPCSDYCFYVFDVSLRVNHIDRTARIDAFSFAEEAYAQTVMTALRMRDYVDSYDGEESMTSAINVQPQIRPDLTDSEFGRIVSKIREHIIAGDAFQVVPSRTFSHPCPDPLLAYTHLKQINPSPYMYFIRDPEYCLLGASPEYAVRFDASSREVSISPIAGTRPRGIGKNGQIDRELDARIELELRTDRKEVAEHLMLLDLARNDLARIAQPGTRYVSDMLHVDRYQSVMHLVSDVHATLRDGLDGFHAYQACMNMGTLSGAPKIMAHELIYRYEGKKRGTYGGVVAIVSNDGSFDSCIAIRSAFVKDGTAYVQAGCGVVYDSNVQAECDETVNKARSVLTALAMATQGEVA